MSRRLFFVCAVLLLFTLISQASALEVSHVNMTLDVQPDFSVHETLHFSFDSPVQEQVLEYAVQREITQIRAFSGAQQLDVGITEANATRAVRIAVPTPLDNLTLSFVVQGAVFTNDVVHHLFLDAAFGQPREGVALNIKLPEGYGLYDEQVRPQGTQVSSDGRRITLHWEGSEQPLLVSVLFVPLDDTLNLWLLGFVLLLVALGGFVLYSRRQNRESFLNGFREDHRKVIRYMQERKQAPQRDVQREFGFSRAKATRIVKALEERGLLYKEEQGRSNKLFWVK